MVGSVCTFVPFSASKLLTATAAARKDAARADLKAAEGGVKLFEFANNWLAGRCTGAPPSPPKERDLPPPSLRALEALAETGTLLALLLQKYKY